MQESYFKTPSPSLHDLSPMARAWSIYPCLLYGLSALFGAALALQLIHPAFAIVFFLFVFFPLRDVQRIWPRLLLALCVGCAAYYWTYARFDFPVAIPEKGIEGVAEIELSSVSLSKTHFGSAWGYQATMHTFVDREGRLIARNVPVHMMIPVDKMPVRPDASKRYLVPSRLKNGKSGHFYRLVPVVPFQWKAIGTSWNLTDVRMQAKSFIQNYIVQSTGNSHVAAFLSGIATGKFNDLELSVELGRFGLLHIMAISGLHFSILALFISFGFRTILPFRIAIVATLILLSCYFLFLGNTPSVLRSWISLMIAFCAVLFGKRKFALNSLGAGLLWIAIADPLLIEQLSFQFSFAVTAAILIWYSPCDQLLQAAFPKRRVAEVIELDSLSQHTLCLLSFFRQSISLSLAVNLVALPLTLFYFQKFPALGLLYNLFFPFMAGLSILLLFLSLLTMCIPWISSILFGFNETYTGWLLNFAFRLPKMFDYHLHVKEFSANYLIGYLFIIYAVGIVLHERFKKDEVAVIL